MTSIICLCLGLYRPLMILFNTIEHIFFRLDAMVRRQNPFWPCQFQNDGTVCMPCYISSFVDGSGSFCKGRFSSSIIFMRSAGAKSPLFSFTAFSGTAASSICSGRALSYPSAGHGFFRWSCAIQMCTCWPLTRFLYRRYIQCQDWWNLFLQV